MSEWSKLVLGESLEALIDNRGKNPPFVPEGIPVISGASVTDRGLDLRTNRRVSPETFRKWMPEPTREGDIVLTSEAPLGRVARIPTSEPLMIAQRVFCLRGKRGVLHSRFLFYALKTKFVQAELAGRATGTTVLGIKQPELLKIRVPAPDYRTQCAIAEFLGALDDKLAANERAVLTGERLSLALVELATDRVTLEYLATRSKQSVKPRASGFVNHFSLPAFDEGQSPAVDPGDSIKSNKFLLDGPCVLMSKLNPRIPRIWNVSELPEGTCVASTEFVVLVPRQASTHALWATLSHSRVRDELMGKVAGTSGSHQRVKPEEILALQVADVRRLPDASRDQIDAIGALGHRLRVECHQLAHTRDHLLPLLMSGKVTVRDVEGDIEDLL